jgi:hypothetical protein
LGVALGVQNNLKEATAAFKNQLSLTQKVRMHTTFWGLL